MSGDFRSRVGDEGFREFFGAEAQQEPIEQAREGCVGERRLRDPGHLNEVAASARDTQEAPHRTRQARHARGSHTARIREMAALTLQHVVEGGVALIRSPRRGLR